jgi:hypothetical protein
MAIFKRLIQNPSSPDKDIKAAGKDRYKQSTFARLTDTNALSRDLADQKLYSVDAATLATASVAITTKKSVIKITNGSTSSTTMTVTLTNSELLLADKDNFFVQTSIASATSALYSVRIVPIAADGSIVIVVAVPTAINWSTNPTYLNVQIGKIGD